MKIQYLSGIEALLVIESGPRVLSKGDILEVTEDEAKDLLSRPTFTIYQEVSADAEDDDSEEE